MMIKVRLFAGLRERAGQDEVEVELPDGSTTTDLLESLSDLVADTRCVVAVNRQYTGPGVILSQGDEVALVPPVSGGSGPWIHVGPEPIDQQALAEKVGDPGAGAIVTFIGVTREVEWLDYEAYAEMARERIREICDQAKVAHGLLGVAAAHRTGAVPLGEASVGIAVSGAHRGEAFAGARDVIDRIKDEAPIWKVEVDGADRRRVEGNLPSAD